MGEELVQLAGFSSVESEMIREKRQRLYLDWNGDR